MLCSTDDDAEDEPLREQLVRPFFGGLGRIAWTDDSSVEFHLGHGDMIRLLRASGFEVENLVELQAPEGATTRYAVRPAGVGPALAVRGGLDRPQARLTAGRSSAPGGGRVGPELRARHPGEGSPTIRGTPSPIRVPHQEIEPA